jgi:hypothetical protein
MAMSKTMEQKGVKRGSNDVHVFPGRVVLTPGVIQSFRLNVLAAGILRHLRGDWGDLCEVDKQLNDEALLKGGHLLSAYGDECGRKFWIRTEADRSYTTVLLPGEN